MTSRPKASIRLRTRSLSLTGIIVTLAVGVLLPVLLSTAVGIVTLALGESTNWVVVGVLVVSFTAAAFGSVVTVTVLLGRRARTARLQADLLANVTHDLRTPLTAIRMYAQTLLSGSLRDDPERTRDSLETIVRETQWLESMIDRVLTWRAASRDRGNLDLEPAPPGPAVEEAIDRFRRMVRTDELSLDLEVESSTPVAHDRDGLGLVVLNLLINAYKYTGDDKHISVRVRDRDQLVVVSVEDNGIGIPRRELPRIFEPFHRVDNRLTSKSSGAGLGLAIVNHIVKAHGGRVEVESSEEQGSRFEVLLPACGEGENP